MLRFWVLISIRSIEFSLTALLVSLTYASEARDVVKLFFSEKKKIEPKFRHIIDGRGDRGQACRRGGGRNAASSPTLNNLVVRRLEGCWTCTESRKPRPLSIADFRLLRTYVVLIPNRQRRNIVGLRTNSAQSKRIIVFEETKKVKKTMYLAMKNLSEYIAASGSYEFKNIWEIWALKYNPEEYMIPYLKQMGEQLCQIDKSEINDVPERKYRETIKRMMKPNIDKEELFNGRE